MFDLKPLSKEAIPAALEKALRYRLLNEPGEAESICHDVLKIDPNNQQALTTLLLALTDRFGKGYGVGATKARDVLPRLNSPYEQAYYGGIIAERQAKSVLQRGGSGSDAYGYLREAMNNFEKAEAIRPASNDDAILHWNACARIIMSNNLSERVEEKVVLQSE
jgi:hypothetical protein